MFSTFGFEEAVKNIYRIAAPYAGSGAVRTTDDLRRIYHDFLTSHLPYMPVNRGDECLIDDEVIEAALVRAYSFNNTLDDLQQAHIIGQPYEASEKRQRLSVARAAIAEFKSLDAHLAILFDLVIHSVVLRPSKRHNGRASFGGSSSAALGTIWLSLGPNVRQADLVEMLLHELTHHLLFIDERSFAHYDYPALSQKHNQAYSAILNLTRPIDKVFHSIVVASELLLGRQRFWPQGHDVRVHPASESMQIETQKALASLYALPNVATLIQPRGHEILTRCAQHCQWQSAVLQEEDS